MAAGLSLKVIRQAIAAQLEANLDDEFNVTWHPPDGSPVPPAVWVEAPEETYVDYWKTFGPDGQADVMLSIEVFIEGADIENVTEALDDCLSVGTGNPNSVIDAVMRDRTLGGVVADCVPLSASENELAGRASIPTKVIVMKQNAEVG